jgi:hypothetical protein
MDHVQVHMLLSHSPISSEIKEVLASGVPESWIVKTYQMKINDIFDYLISGLTNIVEQKTGEEKFGYDCAFYDFGYMTKYKAIYAQARYFDQYANNHFNAGHYDQLQDVLAKVNDADSVVTDVSFFTLIMLDLLEEHATRHAGEPYTGEYFIDFVDATRIAYNMFFRLWRTLSLDPLFPKTG